MKILLLPVLGVSDTVSLAPVIFSIYLTNSSQANFSGSVASLPKTTMEKGFPSLVIVKAKMLIEISKRVKIIMIFFILSLQFLFMKNYKHSVNIHIFFGFLFSQTAEVKAGCVCGVYKVNGAYFLCDIFAGIL